MILTRKKGKLLAIGGREERTGEALILREYVRCAGGEKARITLIVVGAEKDLSIGTSYSGTFRRLGAKEVKVIQVSRRSEAMDQEALEAIEQSTGIFFPGGDQLHLTALLGGTPMDRAIHDRHENGTIIGGTSAGAAMMSGAIIIRGVAERAPFLGGIEMGHGLEFLSGVVIDTHFSQRGRYGRLISAVAQYPHVLGLGIDENTAILVNGERFTVVGEGVVTIIDASASSFTNLPSLHMGDNLALHDIRLHILPNGYQFDLSQRLPVGEEIPSSGKNGRAKKRLSSLTAQRQAGPRVRV